jgi:hypothetical protein
MKMKKEYLILIAVILALGFYLGLRTRDRTHFELPRPEALESGVIDRLVIARPDGPLELVKRDTQWFIQPQGYRADGITVKNMLNQLSDLSITDLVSASGSYERYDLSTEKRINVQAFAGGQKNRDVDIGRPAATYQHTFIKLEGDPNVYHARGSLQNTFDKDLESLRDKVVLAFERDRLTTIEIRKGEQSAFLSKIEVSSGNADKQSDTDAIPESDEPLRPAKIEWQAEDGRKVDQGAVGQLLSAMSQLKCEGYLEQPNDAALEPAWVLTFALDEQSHILTIFPKEQSENRYAAKSSDSPYDFWLPETRVKVFEDQIDQLLGAAPVDENS